MTYILRVRDMGINGVHSKQGCVHVNFVHPHDSPSVNPPFLLSKIFLC